MESSSGKNPFAWLGLLKWSLSYSDGTAPSSAETVPMSDEDRAFLERVMQDGIIDENERMKTILKEVTDQMTKWKSNPSTEEEEDHVEELLQELRDIVEQIDYARAFAAMKGLVFLLGCVGERDHMPRSTRLMCLGLIATMSQNNPSVQKELLELGAIRTLSDTFFVEADAGEDSNGQLRARIIQAIGASVRSHDLAESVFCQLDQAPTLLEMGLGVEAATPSPLPLLKRSLFFLHALVTSDSSSRERVRLFNKCIAWIADNLLDADKQESPEIREMSLALLEQILQQTKSVNAVFSRKDAIVATGVKRVAAIRELTGDNRDFASMELEHWERVIQLLARATPDVEETPLTIAARSASQSYEVAQ